MNEQGLSSSFLQGATELFLSPKEAAGREAELREEAKKAFAQVQIGLAEVEARIRSRFTSEAEILPVIADYLLDLGGKRIRPILAILSSQLFGERQASQGLIDVSAGIELIHMATLLHDDIIDESPKRRHKDSAYSKFGIAPSLLAGDFLWVRAFGLCAHLGELVVRRTEAACIELTEGEILEGNLSLERTLTLKEYENIVAKKTGSLFSLATTVGSYYGGANLQEIDVLSDFGRMAGIAFQMIDDVLDVVADEDLLGKPSGTDLKQQTPSLVNILWLKSAEKQAQEFFSLPQPSAAQVQEAIQALKSSPVIDEAREIAAGYANEAKIALGRVPSSRVDEQVRAHLLSIVNYTLARCL